MVDMINWLIWLVIWTDHALLSLIPTSSTSKTRSELGGIAFPAPPAP